MVLVAGHAWSGLLALSRSRAVVAFAAFLVTLWAVLATAEEGVSAPAILDVRLGVDAEGQTRIVFDADARPDYAVSARADGTIAVSIRDAAFTAPGGRGTGLIAGWQAAGPVATLTLTEPALPVRSFVLAPSGDAAQHRLVIDLASATEAEFAAAAVPGAPVTVEAPAAPSSVADVTLLAPQPSLKPARLAEPARPTALGRGTKTVVLDPGHGGFDPGASGPAGTREEAVTLEAALALRTVLQARGYEVVLTRDADRFVELNERVEIARRAQADLFLSLHADAHEDPSLRGASVYTLSDKRAGRMAREMKSSGDFALYDVALSEEERDVGDILFDIASAETRNASGRLAATLVDELSGRVPMVNNTHRKGSLAVLLSPDVPAVLVEMAFISNAEDEANLTSPRWRRRAMTAVADGIDAYFGAQVTLADEEGRAGG